MSNGPVVVHGQVRPCALRASWMVGGFCAHHSAALRGRTALASAAAKNIVLKCDQRALISPTLGLPGQSSLVEALGGLLANHERWMVPYLLPSAFQELHHLIFTTFDVVKIRWWSSWKHE